jgi:hypothetical protein
MRSSSDSARSSASWRVKTALVSDEKGESGAVPRLYVDAGDVRVQLHSLHVILGQQNLAGEAEPLLHLTMSPSFAVELSRALNEAVRPYIAVNNAAAAAERARSAADDE